MRHLPRLQFVEARMTAFRFRGFAYVGQVPPQVASYLLRTDKSKDSQGRMIGLRTRPKAYHPSLQDLQLSWSEAKRLPLHSRCRRNLGAEVTQNARCVW